MTTHNATLAFDYLTKAQRDISTAIHYLGGAGNPATGLLLTVMQDIEIPRASLAQLIIAAENAVAE